LNLLWSVSWLSKLQERQSVDTANYWAMNAWPEGVYYQEYD